MIEGMFMIEGIFAVVIGGGLLVLLFVIAVIGLADISNIS